MVAQVWERWEEPVPASRCQVWEGPKQTLMLQLALPTLLRVQLEHKPREQGQPSSHLIHLPALEEWVAWAEWVAWVAWEEWTLT